VGEPLKNDVEVDIYKNSSGAGKKSSKKDNGSNKTKKYKKK
jgi:hypothetical protein